MKATICKQCGAPYMGIYCAEGKPKMCQICSSEEFVVIQLEDIMRVKTSWGGGEEQENG